MKTKFSYLIIFLILSVSISAQENINKKYLFDDFEAGKVIYKGSGFSNGHFNYNMISEKLEFISDDGSVLELANPNVVSYAEVKGRILESVGNGVFYEKVVAGDGFLYIQWKQKVLSAGKKGGYGMASPTASIDNYKSVQAEGRTLKLTVEEDYTTVSNNTYYLKVKSKFKRFNSFNSLAKFFKDDEKEITAYVKTENLDFKNPDDVKKAVTYCLAK